MFKHPPTLLPGLFTLIVLLCISGSMRAQSKAQVEQKPAASTDTGIYRTVTNQAIAPGNWQSYLQGSLNFPKEFKGDSVSVRVIVEFVVEKDGNLTHARAIRSEGHINNNKVTAEQLKPFADEAIRVIYRAPRWQAGQHQGIPVRSYFTMPLSFRTS